MVKFLGQATNEYAPPPALSCFLAIPKLELEARQPLRNGDLCGYRGDLQQAFFFHPLLRHRPSISPPHDARCQLVDIFAIMHPLPRGAQSFPPLEWQLCGSVRRRTYVPDGRSVGAFAPRKQRQVTHRSQYCLIAGVPALVGLHG